MDMQVEASTAPTQERLLAPKKGIRRAVGGLALTLALLGGVEVHNSSPVGAQDESESETPGRECRYGHEAVWVDDFNNDGQPGPSPSEFACRSLEGCFTINFLPRFIRDGLVERGEITPLQSRKLTTFSPTICGNDPFPSFEDLADSLAPHPWVMEVLDSNRDWIAPAVRDYIERNPRYRGYHWAVRYGQDSESQPTPETDQPDTTPPEADTDQSVAGGDEASGVEADQSAVGGDEASEAEADQSAVGGDEASEAETDQSAVGGDEASEAETDQSAVGGDEASEAETDQSAVGGDEASEAETDQSAASGDEASEAETDLGLVASGDEASEAETDQSAASGDEASEAETDLGLVASGDEASEAETDLGLVASGDEASEAETDQSAASGDEASEAETDQSAASGDEASGSETDLGLVAGAVALGLVATAVYGFYRRKTRRQQVG